MDDALELLRAITGTRDASFRPGQLEAIDALLQGRRVLVVQRTGWGKSAVYFVATKLLRDAGAGPTLLVSPLLALMRNQLEMARRGGVRAATVNSQNTAEWDEVQAQVLAGEVDLLLVSPERLANEQFRNTMLGPITEATGLLVVDEVHCISDWGHDFRPDYRRIASILAYLPPTAPVLGTTATANDRVIADVLEQLGTDVLVLRGTLDRESLALHVAHLPSQSQRLAWLAATVPALPGSGIVYCLTIDDTVRVAAWLREQGIEATAYSGDTDADERVAIEEDLLANTVKVVVATSALGMGFDKPDLGFVIHYQSPGSPVAYYQQVGRAGRATEHAPAILLSGTEDREIQDYFIRTAFPPREQAEGVVALLEAAGTPMSIGAILAEVNVRRGRLEAMLKVLEVEGALERVGSGYRRTLRTWAYDADRVERVTKQRRVEQEAMLTYARSTDCLMLQLRQQLDDPDAQACGRCANCKPGMFAFDVQPDLVAAATAFLRDRPLLLRPRRQWPLGLGEPSGRLAKERLVEEGRALCLYGDGGWGELVRTGKFEEQWFSDSLVEAAARLLVRWQPEPAPAWVTCVPSTNRPDLVPLFAARLADALALPFHPVLKRVQLRPPQKDMQNSAQQARNVLGAFTVDAPVSGAPVLLVDDIVDSGWTMTVVGHVLLDAGTGPVHPFALARAHGD